MNHQTLTDLLDRIGDLPHGELRTLLIDVTLALVQLNAEVAGKQDKTAGTHAALLKWTRKGAVETPSIAARGGVGWGGLTEVRLYPHFAPAPTPADPRLDTLDRCGVVRRGHQETA